MLRSNGQSQCRCILRSWTVLTFLRIQALERRRLGHDKLKPLLIFYLSDLLVQALPQTRSLCRVHKELLSDTQWLLTQKVVKHAKVVNNQSAVLACRRFCKLSSFAVALTRVLSSCSSDERPLLSLKLSTRVGPSARTATCTRCTSGLGACRASRQSNSLLAEKHVS